jgi:hypothetical protein
MQRRSRHCAVEGAQQRFPIKRHNLLASLRKSLHEGDEPGAEGRIEQPEKRLNVSWLGMPCSSTRNSFRKLCFSRLNRAMSAHVSPPEIKLVAAMPSLILRR